MKIGNFDLSLDEVYIIAELSANHNGNIDTALESIRVAKQIGANAIKLQTYTPDTLTLDSKNDDFIIKGGTIWDNKSLYELYKEAHTPWEWHKQLFDEARKLDIDIFASVFDKTAVDFLEQFNPIAYKIASFEITDYELIRYTASKQKPMIISTGIATQEELQEVVQICHKQGNSDIVLLKCTSKYPAPLQEANLKTILDLKKRFNVEVGFSDHTIGSLAPIIATSLGAKIIEKHFILDKDIGGADASFSMDKNEFENMIKQVRFTSKMLGETTYSDGKNRQFARSLYASKDIKKGETFSDLNIRSVRPSYGLHPKHLNSILGKKAKKDYSFAQRLSLDDLE